MHQDSRFKWRKNNDWIDQKIKIHQIGLFFSCDETVTCMVKVFNKVNSILMKNFSLVTAAGESELILGHSNDRIVNLYYVQFNLKWKRPVFQDSPLKTRRPNLSTSCYTIMKGYYLPLVQMIWHIIGSEKYFWCDNFLVFGHFYLFIRSSGFLFIRSSGFGLIGQLGLAACLDWT